MLGLRINVLILSGTYSISIQNVALKHDKDKIMIANSFHSPVSSRVDILPSSSWKLQSDQFLTSLPLGPV